MAKSYYSAVFEQTADQVWRVIRDFGNDFWWTNDPVETTVEEGKSGDTVGAIRHVRGAGLDFRQRLLALSDRDRFFTNWISSMSNVSSSRRSFVSTLF
jgi:hypothetical protein